MSRRSENEAEAREHQFILDCADNLELTMTPRRNQLAAESTDATQASLYPASTLEPCTVLCLHIFYRSFLPIFARNVAKQNQLVIKGLRSRVDLIEKQPVEIDDLK